MSVQSPTATDLESHPIVKAALDQAWLDSLPGDPVRRHEEGGWIYLNLATGQLLIERATGGIQAAIDLSTPPILTGAVLVGKFHTHPNPSSEGWIPGPSRADLLVDGVHGVPDLIKADNGVYHSGPDRRRGGLGGNPGFPA